MWTRQKEHSSANSSRNYENVPQDRMPLMCTLYQSKLKQIFILFQSCKLFIYLFIHHKHLFFISNLHMSDLTHNCLFCILCFCHFVHCLFVYCYFVVCVFSCHCHSVALWSFCHYNKFLSIILILILIDPLGRKVTTQWQLLYLFSESALYIVWHCIMWKL